MNSRSLERPAKTIASQRTQRWFHPAARECVRVVLVGAMAAFGAISCKKAQGPMTLPPPVVEVMELVATNVARSAELIGQLDSPQNVEIRARVEGFVEKMLFVEGTSVNEGDILFELDKKPFQEALAAANGALSESKAALNKYEKDVARLQPLAEKRAIPQQDLDNAKASVEVGRANLLSAQARVESALLNLGYCDVKAPIRGLIGAKQVSVGELVGRGQATLMATISTLDPIWFYASVSEVEYIRAEATTRATGRKLEDLEVTLILADGTEHPSKGRFVFMDRAVDTKTGTLRIRAEFPNAEKILKPGMFGRVRVNLGPRSGVIVVPERAVAELQGRSFVWVVGADQKVSQRGVKLGEANPMGTLIEEGLKPGERVVVEGHQKVREGGVVQPMTRAQLAAVKASAAAAQAGHGTGAEGAAGKPANH